MKASRTVGRAGVVLLLVLTVAGWAAGGDDEFCATVEVIPVGGGAPLTSSRDGRPAGRGFSASRVLDLQLRVSLQAELTGTHVLELELRTPRANPYQVLTAPVSARTADAGGGAPVPGYPRPLPLQLLHPVQPRGVEGDGWLGDAVLTLPVAGTLIVQTSLYGVWEVIPKLDGRGMTCERRILFEIVR
jgi:hypothetical protein